MDTVYRLGNWEYFYQFRGAAKSTEYAALHYGVWLLELKSKLEAKIDGSSPVSSSAPIHMRTAGLKPLQLKYVHNVAHDGSISSLLALLQVDEMVWPGMGAEVIHNSYSLPCLQ